MSDLAALAADLRALPYTVDSVRQCLGPAASAALMREQPVAADLATRERGGIAALVRLFTLGLPVPLALAESALPRCGVAGLVSLGLASAAEGAVNALVDLRPYGDESHDWFVASDLSELATRAPLRTDHVLGIGGASTTLASWTPRRPVARALDLGTGCGVQALHLSTHADHVVATDLSSRALWFAGLNASLNDLSWDLRRGSLLEPVAGQRFDLIVSNPPFVITPRRPDVPEYEYRDGGMVGDSLVRTLIRSLPGHLAAGGVAQLLANWEVPAGGDWRDVVRRWVEPTGLDAWVIQRETQDPAQYAELWARDGGAAPGSAEYENLYAAWLSDFASRDVYHIGFGVVTLQRPAGERVPFIDLVAVDGPVASPMGPTIDAGLAARSWLGSASDDDVLAVAWQVAPDVTEERFGRPGADDPSVIRLRQGGGLGLTVPMDTALAAYVSVADGTLPAGVALDAIAQLLEVDSLAAVVPQIRSLIADGFLIRG